MKKSSTIKLYLFISLFLTCSIKSAENTPDDNPYYMSFEDLLNVTVSTVSKKDEQLFQASSAIYVITAEDIKRKGAQNIPEALRGVPGVQVQRVNSQSYRVAIRGQSDLYNKSLLVMVDGRTVYTPTFSGVYWDLLKVNEIDRIEVIRGPGATLWGANAVNGIINIISKSAHDTEGGSLDFGYGTQSTETTLRYTLKPEENLALRLYGHHGHFYDLEDTSTISLDHHWELFQGGLKLEWDATKEDQFFLQGDYFTSDTENFDKHREGGNFVLGYTKTHSLDSSTSFQFYYNGYENSHEGSTALTGFTEKINTYDFDLRHQWIWQNHDLTIGAGYRNTDGAFRPSVALPALGGASIIDISSDTYELFNLYFQDKITLVEDTFYLTPGVKVEYNNFTDSEVMPSLRMAYTPDETQTLWASVAKAVRTPSFFEHHSSVFLGSQFYQSAGNTKAEKLISYEIGYRIRALENLSIDLTAFFFDYDHIISYEDSFIATGGNNNKTETYGFETAIKWIYSDSLNLEASYSFNKSDLDLGTNQGYTGAEDDSPIHMASLQAFYNISKKLSFNTAFYYTDIISASNIQAQLKLDCGIIYQATSNLELSLYGSNLLDSTTQEAGNDFGTAAQEIPRSFFANVTYTF